MPSCQKKLILQHGLWFWEKYTETCKQRHGSYLHRSNYAGEISTTATMLVSLYLFSTLSLFSVGLTDLKISMHSCYAPRGFGNFIWNFRHLQMTKGIRTSAGPNNFLTQSFMKVIYRHSFKLLQPFATFKNGLVFGLNLRALFYHLLQTPPWHDFNGICHKYLKHL